MESIKEFLDGQILGVTMEQLALAFLAVLLGFVLRKVVLVTVAQLARAAGKTGNKYDDLLLRSISRPVAALFPLGGVWVALNILPLPVEPLDLPGIRDALARAGSVVLGIWLSLRLINELFDHWGGQVDSADNRFLEQILPIGRNTTRVFLFLLGGVLVARNLGYSLTSVVAGLGLGGMAVALASKDTLANLFGSIVVLIDRPFMVGDWVEIDTHEGTVEEVGLRVSRIRTFANSLITIPNSQLTTTAINNWSRMQKRRIKLSLGLTFDTSPEQMEQAVEALRQVIREDQRMRQDFYLVNFNEVGPSSLNILVYCFTRTTNWAEFLQVQQELLLKFIGAIRGLGLEFAFPTTTVHLAGSPEHE